uniref:Uncharacterized protein n=1 Tax=Nelumbo nucifera TaxID=4432 RepID=A0A822ZDR1_NELNU|nr:TPA_asm: hypothetical protein HUJ06_002564 [Nelumbo nucifera]
MGSGGLIRYSGHWPEGGYKVPEDQNIVKFHFHQSPSSRARGWSATISTSDGMESTHDKNQPATTDDDFSISLSS